MQSLRQLGVGILFGALSLIIVIGGFALSMAEGGPQPSQPSQPTVASVVLVTVYPTLPLLLPTDTLQSALIPTNTSLVNPTVITSTTTPPPPPTSCLPPTGWIAVVVQSYDSLNSLALAHGTTTQSLQEGNCLIGNDLVVGSYLYVPPLPTSTFLPCGAPYGWITYYVQPGDTLYHISLLYRVSVQNLQQANCMGYSTFLKTGQALRVPNVQTSTPFVYPTAEIMTATNTPIPPTEPQDTATMAPTITIPAATDTLQVTSIPSDTPVPPTDTQVTSTSP